MVRTPPWFVLGFTADDVIDAGQDSRLARECVMAWRSAGRPPDFQILHAAGAGAHIVEWFVNSTAAVVLDSHGVHWRDRIIGERPTPPALAKNALKPGAA